MMMVVTRCFLEQSCWMNRKTIGDLGGCSCS